ncbi:hypothetical protein J6590_031344 [Homalodisca vitripennis]|nr:hypothetical protein J6590_031344 [Homalodisca vitripennis]
MKVQRGLIVERPVVHTMYLVGCLYGNEIHEDKFCKSSSQSGPRLRRVNILADSFGLLPSNSYFHYPKLQQIRYYFVLSPEKGCLAYHRTESGGMGGSSPGTPPMCPVPRRWDWNRGARWAREREEHCQSSESLLSFFQRWSAEDNITLPEIAKTTHNALVIRTP